VSEGEGMNLPGGKAARKRELEIREGARTAAYDAALGILHGARLPDVARPLHATANDIETLSALLAETEGRYLPRGSRVEVTDVETTTEVQRPYGRHWEKRATSVSIWPLGPMTIEEILRLGILDRRGNVSMVAFETAMAAMDGACERMVRPWEGAAIPGRLR
jgi:hypothetical protein